MSITTQIVEEPGSALVREVELFLARQPRGRASIEHDPRWLPVLREGLRHRTFMIVARAGLASGTANGPIVGYLPLALVASRLFGRFLVSLPYLNRAGVVVEGPGVAVMLIDRAVELAREHDAQYLELRQNQPMEHQDLTAQRNEKVRMVRELPTEPEILWKSVDAKVRNQVRKGDKSALKMRWGGAGLVDAFYGVFAVNMRDLGTPVYPRRLFTRILELMPECAELGIVECEGNPVAGALLIHDVARHESQVPSASCLRSFNSTSANMWMYHQLLCRSIQRGSHWFDFGRSSVDSGTYRFKQQWGAQPQATAWQYHVRHGDIDAVRPQSPRYKRKIEAWQKLPVWVTKIVGPAIVRGIP